MSFRRSVIRRRMADDIRYLRGAGVPARERDARQGGGKFTKPAPKVRTARRRAANMRAKAARRANR